MANISAADPIGEAMSRTGQLLFRPFSLTKWLAICVGAWLTLVGEASPLEFLNFIPQGGGGGPGGGGPTFDEVMEWIRVYLVWITAIAVVVILVLFAIYLLVRWLNSRGQFMFYDSIVGVPGRVGESWSRHRALANNLMKLRIIWDFILFNTLLFLLIAVGALLFPDAKPLISGEPYRLSAWTAAAVTVAVFGLLAWAVLFWFFDSILYHLAVPIMYVRGIAAWPACKEAWTQMVRPHLGHCLLFFLFMSLVRAIWTIWAAAVGTIACCLTCFTTACLMSIPIAGQYLVALLTLPVLTFGRAYQLLFIAQFGTAYSVVWQLVTPTGFPVVMDRPPSPLPPPEAPPPFPPPGI